MRIKALTVHCAIITILVYSFLIGYTSVAGLPSYADDSIEWENCTTAEEQAEAFKAYCKSRDLTIEGSIADGVTSFTTQTYQTLVNTLGLNINALQADIKRTTDSNGAVKYLFNASGISAMNRIFSQFLQDHDLEVGDSANQEDNTVYSGKVFEDLDGNGCLCYIFKSNYGSFNSDNKNLDYWFANIGTYYKITGSNILNAYKNGTSSITFNLSSRTSVNCNIYYSTGWGSSVDAPLRDLTRIYSDNSYYTVYNYSNEYGYATNYGSPIIIYNPFSNSYYLAAYSLSRSTGNINLGQIVSFTPDNTPQTCIIFLYSPTINNNNYTNNTYTTINNDGDVYNYDTDEEPDPDDNPSGGGGGGGNDTTTPPTDTGGGDGEDDTTITFPDFDFNFPEINWSIGDLSNKFPFSIPFDLVAFFTVLNAEPQAPAIDAEIPLGSFYTWHFEADFSQFDNYAVIVRNVEFIAFVIGLIYLTIKLVRG